MTTTFKYLVKCKEEEKVIVNEYNLYHLHYIYINFLYYQKSKHVKNKITITPIPLIIPQTTWHLLHPPHPSNRAKS